MRQLEQIESLQALARTIHISNLETTAWLCHVSWALQELSSITPAGVPDMTFVAQSVHILPCNANGDPTSGRPAQVSIHGQKGLGVIVWPDLDCYRSHRRMVNPLDEGASFISIDACESLAQTIAMTELPSLLMAVRNRLAGELARLS